jgi:hypothetical protein
MRRKIWLDRQNRDWLPTSSVRLLGIIGLFFTMSGLLVVSGRANPATVFSTFGPDNLYDSARGEVVQNVSQSFQALAAAFMPDQSGALEGVDLGMSGALGGSLSVSLFADKNNFPDSANASFLGSVTPTAPSSVLSLTSVVSPMLHAGTQYWIGVEAPFTPTTHFWNFATSEHTGTVAISSDPHLLNWNVATSQTQYAFDVLATIPVPEPEPTWLVVTGMICLFGIATWRTYSAYRN